MTSTARKRAVPALALSAVAALVLSGCGGGSSDSADPTEAATTPTTSESPEETPTGPVLTDPGSQLAYGDTATVDYRARTQRTDLALTVFSAQKGALKDFAGFDMSDPLQKNANYYYVRVGVKNVGEEPMSGVEVPLWGISGTNTLLPPVKFTSAFKKCPTDALPAKFGPGDAFRTCLVFLSPNKGALDGVSYRPLESFDPIEWRGELTQPAAPKKKPRQPAGQGSGG